VTARIAVFDSGIGGTGVLREVRERAPRADIVYLADRAYGPYGERTLDEVRERTALIANYLRSAGVELVVIACNSASAAALHHLRETVPDVAFVGMEPAVKPAAERTRAGTVAVMATGATFQGELFRSLVGRFSGDVEIFEQACPGLAKAIEEGAPVDVLLDDFMPLVADSGADVVVLGCTHYPLIADEIASRLAGSVILIDPAAAVATQVLAVAKDRGMDLKGSGSVEYWTTELEADGVRTGEWTAIDIDVAALSAVRVGRSSLTTLVGDITAMPVVAVINAANEHLVHGGGVALAIARAGGQTIEDQSREWVDANGPLTSGAAALTSGGAMPSSYVIHVAGPIYREGHENESLLGAAVMAALGIADEVDARSVAMPAISSGVYGYPADDACRIIVESVAGYLSTADSSLGSVRLVGFDTEMGDRFASAIDSLGAIERVRDNL
jgi:glutamate racemase